MFYERYRGEFCSRTEQMWRVSILLEANTPFAVIGKLDFPAEEPLVIEREEVGKEKPIVGSIATLTLLSPGDRTYEDLYTIAVGKIRMDVYREGELYWSGALDPEFYEEPYATTSDYEVSLTFSDFGILERLKYDMAGMKTLREITQYSLGRSAINYEGLDEGFISTSLTPDSAAITLADLKVRSDNFYDEDGEALSLRKVLEGIFQPLALRMEQRNGKIWIYDLHGLYTKAQSRLADWQSDDQTMGVDVVYNNAKITWSPYAQSGNLAVDECWTKPVNPEFIALNSLGGGQSGTSTYYSYHYSTDLKDWIDAEDAGFTLWVDPNGENLDYLVDAARYFKIVPQYDGSDAEGVALLWPSVHGYKQSYGSSSSAGLDYQRRGLNVGYLLTSMATAGQIIFKSKSVWIPPVDKSGKVQLRILVDMLLDPRFNPFEEASNWGGLSRQKDWQNQWNSQGNFVYLPVTVKFQPEDSETVYCWTNQDIVSRQVSSPVRHLSGTLGEWVEFDTTQDEDPSVWGYFAYYDSDDHQSRAGVGGWKKNRPAINPHKQQLVTTLKKIDDGQYIPYPTFGGRGGRLWVELRSRNWTICDGGNNFSKKNTDLWSKVMWIMMALPEVEIVNNNLFDRTISTEDIEYKAELNGAAKEPIEIDTICGSNSEAVPTARGAYFSVASGKQITKLSRAGRTTQIEELLIGTLYSQFADRRTRLSGTTTLYAGGVATFQEAAQAGKIFLLSGSVENPQDGTSETSLVELRPDEYDKE